MPTANGHRRLLLHEAFSRFASKEGSPIRWDKTCLWQQGGIPLCLSFLFLTQTHCFAAAAHRYFLQVYSLGLYEKYVKTTRKNVNQESENKNRKDNRAMGATDKNPFLRNCMQLEDPQRKGGRLGTPRSSREAGGLAVWGGKLSHSYAVSHRHCRSPVFLTGKQEEFQEPSTVNKSRLYQLLGQTAECGASSQPVQKLSELDAPDFLTYQELLTLEQLRSPLTIDVFQYYVLHSPQLAESSNMELWT